MGIQPKRLDPDPASKYPDSKHWVLGPVSERVTAPDSNLNLGAVEHNMEPKVDQVPQQNLLVAIHDLKGLGDGDPVYDAGREEGGGEVEPRACRGGGARQAHLLLGAHSLA